MSRAYYDWSLLVKYKDPNPFISTWDTTKTSAGSSANNQVKLPLLSTGTYNFIVDWGDGKTTPISLYNQAEVTHTYATSGVYQIKITGTFIGFRFNNAGDVLKILSVQRWGILKLGTVASSAYFQGCANLNLSTVADVLDLTGVTSLYQFLTGCTSTTVINRIEEWDVSKVTDFSYFFYQGPNTFTQSLNTWNTSSATNMSGMFFQKNHNIAISNWDVSKVTNMNSIFYQNTAFNQDISNWNTGKVTNFQSAFNGALAFNQNIGNWDVSKATTMNQMFNSASAFNQNIGNWNTANVIDMQFMFQSAAAFNQNIGNWVTTKVNNYSSFMAAKTAANYSTANLDAIYNNWIKNPLIAAKTISFNTIKYTLAATDGRALLTRANATINISNITDNGSGFIRVVLASVHGLTTGNKIFISGVVGTTEANGLFIITVVDTLTVDLQGITFTNPYVSGGVFRTGYGWAITDGGI